VRVNEVAVVEVAEFVSPTMSPPIAAAWWSRPVLTRIGLTSLFQQVVRRRHQKGRIIPEPTESDIAVVTEDAAHLACLVVMIDH
jgi:hypothetical protein